VNWQVLIQLAAWAFELGETIVQLVRDSGVSEVDLQAEISKARAERKKLLEDARKKEWPA